MQGGGDELSRPCRAGTERQRGAAADADEETIHSSQHASHIRGRRYAGLARSNTLDPRWHADLACNKSGKIIVELLFSEANLYLT